MSSLMTSDAFQLTRRTLFGSNATWATHHGDGSVSGLLGEVHQGKADICTGGLSSSLARDP